MTTQKDIDTEAPRSLRQIVCDMYDEYMADEHCDPLKINAYIEEAGEALKAPDRDIDTLVKAARDVIARWDSPRWKWDQHTGEFINALRQALQPFTGTETEGEDA